MKKNRGLYLIIALVIFIHFSGILWIGSAAPLLKYTPSEKRLVVKTVSLVPEKPGSVKKTSVISKKTPVTVKKSSPVLKKETKKPEIVKNQSKREKLLAKAKVSFGKVTKKHSNREALEDVSVIDSLKVDSIEKVNGVDQGYLSILAGCLRCSLRLPEYGDIRVSLCLSSQGSIVEIKILNAENENNKRYVEKVLPTVLFPAFEKYFKNEKNHTFTITLTNDI